MANTYTQIHIQAVFAVQNRLCLIDKEWKHLMYKYMTGIVHNHGHKMLAVNSTADHVHLLIGFRPTQSLADLMQDVKGSSSKWINENKLVKGRFSWKEGYGAFSYEKRRVKEIVQYIMNQEQHHQKKNFQKEYQELLEEFGVNFDSRYVFQAV
jgi:putative transposase